MQAITTRCAVIFGTVAVVAMLAMVAVAQPPKTIQPPDDAALVRALPVAGMAAGKTEVEALVLGPQVIRVVFMVDGEAVAERNRPPYRVAVRFDDPPREQTLRVVALGERGSELGVSEIVVNRHDPPFAVRIAKLASASEPGFADLEVEVSVPRGAELAHVDVLAGEQAVARLVSAPFAARIPLPAAGQGMVVRAEASLVDGRATDDAAVIGEALSEEVAVNLVELQALVTSRDGRPLSGLTADDFVVHQDKQPQTLDRFYRADDVALSIALLVDSSGSMAPIWQRTVAAARQFLDQVLRSRDRALLVEFADRIRLAHALSADVASIAATLEATEPEGGTALYDSMLFALLQLVDVPGRRAVVVVSDGIDSGSRSQPQRVIEIARRLGIPIYLVGLPSGGGAQTAALARGGVQAEALVADLRMLAEPTGGRVFRVPSAEGLSRALAQIGEELRNQYVLTYYAETLPTDPRAVDVEIRGQKGLRVRAVFPLGG